MKGRFRPSGGTPARWIFGSFAVGAIVAGLFADVVLDVDAFLYIIVGGMVAQLATGFWWQRREQRRGGLRGMQRGSSSRW